MFKNLFDRSLSNTCDFIVTSVVIVLSLASCSYQTTADPSLAQETTPEASSALDLALTDTPVHTDPIWDGRNLVETIDNAPISEDFLSDPSDDKCSLPCWYGLRPHISTFEETNETIRRLYGLEGDFPREIYDDLEDDQVAYFYTAIWLQDDQSREVTVYFDKDNYLYAIEVIEVLDNGSDLNLERILTEIGPPDEIWVDPSYSVDWVTSVRLVVELFYFEHNLRSMHILNTPLVVLENGSVRTELCLEQEQPLLNEMFIFPEHDYSLYGRYTRAYEENGEVSPDYVSLEDFFSISIDALVSHVEETPEKCILSQEW